MEEKKRGHEPDRYEDFLDELSHFSAKDEEEYLVDSTKKAPSVGEIILKVGEGVKEIREKKGLSLQDISQIVKGDNPIFSCQVKSEEIVKSTI